MAERPTTVAGELEACVGLFCAVLRSLRRTALSKEGWVEAITQRAFFFYSRRQRAHCRCQSSSATIWHMCHTMSCNVSFIGMF